MRRIDLSNGYKLKDCPKIAIVVLNWNGWKDTIECLESLEKINYSNYQVIVVDNGSQDNSLTYLEQWCSKKGTTLDEDVFIKTISMAKKYSSSFRVVAVVASKQGATRYILLDSGYNRGYSGGNNVGLAWALAADCDYVLILNNDTIVHPDFLNNMVEAVFQSGASIVGALIRDIDSKEPLFVKSSYPIMFFISEPQINIPDQNWWISDRVDGSAMMLSKDFLLERWQSLGYFLDESLFLYCEEIELSMWCRRTRKKSIVARNAVVYHKLGAGMGGRGHPLQFYYLTRNRILLSRRYFLDDPLVFTCFFLCYPLWRLVRASIYFIQGRPNIAWAILYGLLDGFKGRQGRRNV